MTLENLKDLNRKDYLMIIRDIKGCQSDKWSREAILGFLYAKYTLTQDELDIVKGVLK